MQGDQDAAQFYDRDHYSTDGLYRLRLKLEVFDAYGGCRCDWCDVSDPVVLTIDHIHQDGAERRRDGEPYGGTAIYRWLKDQGYPPGYRVLCFNHNIMAAWLAQRGIHQDRVGNPIGSPAHASQRTLLDIAQELGFCESTLRVWIARDLEKTKGRLE